MAAVIDLTAELANLTMLRGRTPQTTRAERQGSSRNLAAYRDGAIFTTKFSGEGGWEWHRNGEGIVHILDGETIVHLMTEAGPETLELHAGMIAVVPRGAWHQFSCPGGVTLMTVTPQPTIRKAMSRTRARLTRSRRAGKTGRRNPCPVIMNRL